MMRPANVRVLTLLPRAERGVHAASTCNLPHLTNSSKPTRFRSLKRRERRAPGTSKGRSS